MRSCAVVLVVAVHIRAFQHVCGRVEASDCGTSWDSTEQPVRGDVLLQSWHVRYSSQDAQLKAKRLPHGSSNGTSTQGRDVLAFAQRLDEDPSTTQQPDIEAASVTSTSSSSAERAVAHSAVAAMLLLFLAFVMSLFYLVNFPDLDIQRATWQLLSRTISIFIAVLISKSTKEVMCEGLKVSCEDKISHRMSAVTEQQVEYAFDGIGIAFARWIMFWIIFQLYMLQYEGTFIIAISKLGGHIVAFAGLDAFTALQNGQAPFDSLRQSAINSFGCAIAVGFLLLIGLGLWGAGRTFLAERSSNPESLKHWLHHCCEAENEAASLVVGLLLSQAIRHAISGEHPPLHGGKPKSKTNDQVFLLFATAIGVGALVSKLEQLLTKLQRNLTCLPDKHEPGMARFVAVTVDTVSMTMAWCLLYWGEWFIYNWTDDKGVGHGDRMTALLVVAGVLSALCFAGIFLIVFAARHQLFEAHTTGLHALGIALGLVVGCAWEDVFIEAVGGVHQLNVFDLKASYATLLIIFCLCVVTLPAWMLYILPQAEHKLEQSSLAECDFDAAS